MVNPNSKTFQFFEKVGYVGGRLIRYAVCAAAIGLLGTILGKKALDSPSKPNVPSSPPSP